MKHKSAIIPVSVSISLGVWKLISKSQFKLGVDIIPSRVFNIIANQILEEAYAKA